MSKFACVILSVILLSRILAQSPEPRPPDSLDKGDGFQGDVVDPRDYWKTPLPKRGEEKLKLTMRYKVFPEGSMIYLFLVTQNLSDHPILEKRTRGVCEKPSWGIRIKNPAGNVVMHRERKVPQVPSDSHHIIESLCIGSESGAAKVVEPGHVAWEPWTISPDDYDLSAPGKYTFQVYEGPDLQHAVAKSNVLRITIVPKPLAEK